MFTASRKGSYSLSLSFISISVSYPARYAVSLLRVSRFPESTDYIFTLAGAHHFDYACSLLPHGIVVEPSSLRGLAADCPFSMCLGFNLAPSTLFFLLSLPSHLCVSSLCCGLCSFRGFQQFNGCFIIHISVYVIYLCCFYICLLTARLAANKSFPFPLLKLIPFNSLHPL